MNPTLKWWLPRIALGCLFVTIFVTFSVSGWHHWLSFAQLKTHLTDVQELARDYWPFSVLIYFAVYVLTTSFSIPTGIWLTLIGGAVFGRWIGGLTALSGATVGATLAMLSGRYLFRDWVERKFGGRLATVNRRMESDGAYYLLSLRLIPGMPFWLLNIGMGLTRMPVLTYAVVSFFGMMPVTFLIANAGTELATIESVGDIFSTRVLLAFVLLAIVPIVLRFVMKRFTTLLTAG